MIPTDHAGIDSGLEALVNQYPPCCRPCEKTKLGEFILNPADTATRHLRKDEGADAGTDGAVKGGVVRYGLRDWTQAGFYLVPPGEARDRVLDSALTIILNLQVAVHRKTSLERYCWIVAKSKIEALFSAPNYCGEFDNSGAMMSVDDTLMCSFQVLKPVEKRDPVKNKK